MSKDVEVTYTGTELYHLADNDLGYDGKISTRSDGGYAKYETDSDWQDHSHKEYDSDGNLVYSRDEGENHSWSHRQRDYILKVLTTLSFEELQTVEAFSNNIYLKQSARKILNKDNQEQSKSYILKP